MKSFNFIKTALAVATIGCAAMTQFAVHAAVITWTNAGSGGWSTAVNWSPNSVPGANDTAIITNAGVTVALSVDTGAGAIILGTNGGGAVTLELNSQTLTLNGPLTVNPSGAFTVDSGELFGYTNAVLHGPVGWSAGALGGTLTLAAGGTLNLTTANDHNLNGTALTNYGSVVWNNGTIQTGNGTAIYNYGLWDCQSDQQINLAFGGSGATFDNYGTLRKSGGVGNTTTSTLFGSGVFFNQLAGVIDVQNGTNGLAFAFQGGGNFNGGYITTNQFGYTILSIGSFNLNGTVTGTNTLENTGNLVGTNVIQGALTWIGGNWNGAYFVTIATNSTLLVAGGGSDLDFDGVIVTNYGTVAWSSGTMQGGGGSIIYNYGLWNCQSDQTLNDAYGGSGLTFNNYAAFRKSAGINSSQTLLAGGVLFNQLSGQVDLQAGNLVLQGGGNFTGGTATNNNGELVFSIGNFYLNGTRTGTNVFENSGNLVGTNVIQGGLQWEAGNWNGSYFVTIATNSILFVAGGANDMDLDGVIVTNYGTIAWSSGTLQGGNGSIIYNYGLWNCQSDQTFNNAYGGIGATFDNYGTFLKSGNSGTTLLDAGVAFNNTGAVNVQSGILDFNGGGVNTGGTFSLSATAFLDFNNETFATSTTIAGTNLVTLAGATTVNGVLTITNMQLVSGTLGGINALAGSLVWSGGSLTGVTTIPANSTLIITGGGDNDMNGVILTNYGTVTWVSGTIQTGNGTAIYNYGLWDCQSDQQINLAFGGSGATFDNYGTLRKSGGVGNTTTSTLFGSGVFFNQLAGVIDVQNGTNGLAFAFQGGGNFNGGYITTNQFGYTILSIGSFNLNGTVTGTNTLENTGNLVGTNIIQGALTWVGGNWNGSYFVTITTNSTLLVAGGGNDLNFESVIVTNYGTVTWSSGTLQSGNGSSIYNYGLWNCQSDQTLNDAYGGSGSTFNNYGTLRKSGGVGDTTTSTLFGSGVFFNQLAGVIDVQNGTNGLAFAFQGGGNFNGGYITTNQFGYTVLSIGNFNLNGTVTGTNTLEDTGNLVGTNVIQGALTWVGGNWNASYFVTIATNSTLTVAGGSGDMEIEGVLVTNNGTVVWSSGTIQSGNGTTIYNNGVWNAQSDQVFNDAYGGAGTVFNNPGTFIKTAGTNNGSGTQIQSGVTFNNSGRLDCRMGVISLQGVYSLTNGTLNFGINGRTNYGEISLSGAAALTGTVSADLNNGYIPVEGNAFTNLYYGSFTGGFTNTVLPFADAWTTNYFPTYYVITVVNSRPVLPVLATNKFVVNELTLLSVTNTATDADIPAQTLSYALLGGTNGMILNSTYGIFTWTPQQTNSPSTNLLSVVVTDTGTPALSATNTFTVIVQEVNQAPTLGVLGTQTLTVLQPFSLNNSAAEPNIHSVTAGYVLVSPPLGASINSSGLITWTPAANQTLTTNTITTIVTNSNPYDLVNPHLSATNSFQAIVLPNTIRTNLSVLATNTSITLKWPADHTGWRIESQTNSLSKGLGANWVPVTGSAATNQLVFPIVRTNGTVMFRMVYP